MCGMRPLRNFKTNQCCHLIVAADTREAFGGARRSRAESRRPSRIANRTFFLWLSVDDEKQCKTRLAKAGYIAAVDAENLHSPQRKYRLVAKGRKLVS